ncbi:hypothetical protein ACOKFD_11820 [Flagellimonas sp. S174]|uniref:hypothetical protein n=1 Tax=Flagellimonas sp. S174 TaxID=3410790 RepID=UPI003BF4B13A
MNRLVIFYGCALLASSAIAEIQQKSWDFNHPNMEVVLNSTNAIVSNNVEDLSISTELFCTPCMEQITDADLDINEIDYVTEDTIELGFNTSDYLPENFDPYTAYLDIDSVVFVEDEPEFIADFNTQTFLPQNFDSYTDIVSVDSINYVEEEESDLGFDTSKYLPYGFSPHEAYFDIDNIIYIDIDSLDNESWVSPWEMNTENEPYN